MNKGRNHVSKTLELHSTELKYPQKICYGIQSRDTMDGKLTISAIVSDNRRLYCLAHSMKMPTFLRITRIPYEEPYHIHLRMSASNGRQVSEIEFYINSDTLSEWAEGLEGFPRHQNHIFLWEVGSERLEDKWAYYLRFRAITTDASGHCAIHLRLNNNAALPEREISEFCIRAEAGAINRLGRLFREFRKLEHEFLMWTPLEGKLFKNTAEAGPNCGLPMPDENSETD